jgi:hypothetical protein
LGIKPERQGNLRYLSSDQLALGQQLHEHITSGKPMESFPRPDQPEGGLVARRVAGPGLVAGQVDQASALAAALAQLMPAAPAVDPLQRARGLAEAADSGLVLTTGDLAQLLGQGVTSWRDGHQAYGYRFNRHKQGIQVLWTVARALALSTSPATSTTYGTSPATSRPVGFLAAPEARSCITVQAIALPAF